MRVVQFKFSSLDLQQIFNTAHFNERSVIRQIGLLSSVKNIEYLYRILRIKWTGLNSSGSPTGRLQALGSRMENLLGGQTPHCPVLPVEYGVINTVGRPAVARLSQMNEQRTTRCIEANLTRRTQNRLA